MINGCFPEEKEFSKLQGNSEKLLGRLTLQVVLKFFAKGRVANAFSPLFIMKKETKRPPSYSVIKIAIFPEPAISVKNADGRAAK